MKIQPLKTPSPYRNRDRARVDAEPGDELDKAGLKWLTIVVEDSLPQPNEKGVVQRGRQYTIYIEKTDADDTAWDFAGDPPHPASSFDALVRDYLNHPSRKNKPVP